MANNNQSFTFGNLPPEGEKAKALRKLFNELTKDSPRAREIARELDEKMRPTWEMLHQEITI